MTDEHSVVDKMLQLQLLCVLTDKITSQLTSSVDKTTIHPPPVSPRTRPSWSGLNNGLYRLTVKVLISAPEMSTPPLLSVSQSGMVADSKEAAKAESLSVWVAVGVGIAVLVIILAVAILVSCRCLFLLVS